MAAGLDTLVPLAERLLATCRARGLTLATAESCTGGLVGHLLTEVPGSSDVFQGGVVAYADQAKVALLDVPGATLAGHGAVSAQVAVAMAEGARRRLGVSLAAAVTGIAGPTGAAPGKPVGLTYVALADGEGHDVRRFVWHGDRGENKRASAEAVLALLLERVGEGTA